MIRVLLVDDEALVRAGLRMIVESDPSITVVDEVDDGAEAVEAVCRSGPDVVLMDVRMPRMDGVTATAAVRSLDDPPAVVMLTTFDTDEHVYRALENGAAGFLLKDTPPQELLRAIGVVHRGDSMLAPEVTRRLVERFTTQARPHRQREALALLEPLTEREREVLVEVGHGCSNAEVAARLHMSEATVKSHLGHVFDKLGTTGNRVQVAIAAHRAGLVE